MKTFSDLEFKPHSIARQRGERGAEIAKLRFPNGNGVSAIRGSSRFQSGPGTYELAISRPHKALEIRSYQTAGDITAIMKELQSS